MGGHACAVFEKVSSGVTTWRASRKGAHGGRMVSRTTRKYQLTQYRYLCYEQTGNWRMVYSIERTSLVFQIFDVSHTRGIGTTGETPPTADSTAAILACIRSPVSHSLATPVRAHSGCHFKYYADPDLKPSSSIHQLPHETQHRLDTTIRWLRLTSSRRLSPRYQLTPLAK